MRRTVPILASAALLLGLFVGTVSAYTNYGGGWEAEPGQGATSFGATVQQPINADGSSKFSSKGGGVIPVKFALTQGTGPFVFESRQDEADGPLWSNVVYTPQTTTTVSEVTNLSAVYDFTVGDCRGGSLRWQLHTTGGADIYVYFYQVNGTVSCDGANSTSGTNIVGLGGNVDYSGAIGTYVDWADMLANSGLANATVQWAALIIDSGWGGDQIVDLTSASFNANTFTVPAPSAGSAVCPTQEAVFSVEKLDGTATASVSEAASIQPKDDNGIYRIVDCKYMYNLAVGSLRGAGSYVVKATIGGTTFVVATFDLK